MLIFVTVSEYGQKWQKKDDLVGRLEGMLRYTSGDGTSDIPWGRG